MPGGLSLARYVFDKGRLQSGAAKGGLFAVLQGSCFLEERPSVLKSMWLIKRSLMAVLARAAKVERTRELQRREE